jgi:ParB family chromosome partitioning protein
MNRANKKASVKSVPATKNESFSSGLGLEGLGDLSALLDAPAKESSGNPLALLLDLIDEDPNQPRTSDNPGFSESSLHELAASIELRGVKTPISVRDNPDSPGRYVINHGARRFRASKIAGQETIPGFVDNDYNEADQVVENLQRNELTAREIADFIGRELAKGIKKGEIAKAISKSPAFVSQHVTLLDLPDTIAEAFNSGRVNDVTVINELVTAYKKNARDVDDWISLENQEITRGSVKLLREFLEEKKAHNLEEDDDEVETDTSADVPELVRQDEAEKIINPEKLKKAIVLLSHDGRTARLILTKRPSAEGFAWLKYEDDGLEFEADLSRVKLIALIEG